MTVEALRVLLEAMRGIIEADRKVIEAVRKIIEAVRLLVEAVRVFRSRQIIQFLSILDFGIIFFVLGFDPVKFRAIVRFVSILGSFGLLDSLCFDVFRVGLTTSFFLRSCTVLI